METCINTVTLHRMKKKYIKASSIIFVEEGYVPEEVQIGENGVESKSENNHLFREISSHQISSKTNASNVSQRSDGIDICPLKMHFGLSKEPIGVGRFGVVYKASNIKIRLPKRKSDNEYDAHTELLYRELKRRAANQPTLALKMIRNKSASTKSSNSTKTKKNAINSAFKHSKELSILKLLNHENVVQLFYFSCDDILKHDIEDDVSIKNNSCDHGPSIPRSDKTLSLFLSFMPTTLQLCLEEHGPLINGDSLSDNKLGLAFVKQLYAALEYIRSLCICHRDIKPSNILLDVDNKVLKLSDFGSAIQLRPKTKEYSQQTNILHLQSYVCSRYYRAPELILGSDKYGCEIDIWSVGCVVAEMVMARPLFPGM